MAIPKSRRVDFSEIPIIDLQPLLFDDADPQTIDSVVRACSDVGFFYIKNHGVPSGLMEQLVTESKLFFDQPDEVKRKILIDPTIRGYLPLYYRSYEGEQRAGTSHQEGFWIGHDTEEGQKSCLDGSNQWPKSPAGLKPLMLRCFQEIEGLSLLLQKCFAHGLGLDSEYFLSLFDKPTSRFKVNHYPPQDDPVDENNIGVVPHTDSGGFTILWQDQHGGLEIQSKNGDWVGAPPIEDTFVVNLGNIMQVWSNGRFASTPHRVINRGGNDRYSIPLFVNPNFEAVIQPLVGDLGSVQAFVYGEYQTDLWRRTFPIANIPT